jgi:hypothetical protein
MMPPVETAARMPLSPSGLKPSAACRFETWKFVSASTRMVRRGIATFHQVAALLVAASLRTPRKLIAVITAMMITATTIPVPVSTPVVGSTQLLAKL